MLTTHNTFKAFFLGPVLNLGALTRVEDLSRNKERLTVRSFFSAAKLVYRQ